MRSTLGLKSFSTSIQDNDYFVSRQDQTPTRASLIMAPPPMESIYEEILSRQPGSNEAALREYETALIGLGELYRDNKKAHELAQLVETSRGTLSSFAKAKTAKLGECQHDCNGINY